MDGFGLDVLGRFDEGATYRRQALVDSPDDADPFRAWRREQLQVSW